MQTIYFKTSSFIKHKGNVVDLGVYRQRLALAAGEGWRDDREAAEAGPAEAEPVLTLMPPAAKPVRRAGRRERLRRQRLRRFGILLDLCATLAIVALTAAAVAAFLGV